MRYVRRLALLALFALACTHAAAAKLVGYSVNSDEPLGDSLYRIDLLTGETTWMGDVLSSQGLSRSDIEGLAFDSNNKLWAVDDESGKLFPINVDNALVLANEEVSITGLSASQGNDFGMTFTCAGDMFVTSVESRSLYVLGLDGFAEVVGSPGSLDARISSLAAYGNPAKLYGLGNGLVSEDGPRDNRSLFEINMETGEATLIGPVGEQVADYFEAGLAFSEDGSLWAITDRRTIDENLGSQVLQIDLETGNAAVVSTTSVAGFESLAIAPPSGCEQAPANHETPHIPVLDRYGLALTFLVLLATGMVALQRSRS